MARMKDVHQSVMDLIGRTPIVRLNRMGRETGAALYAKLEYLNPGASIKDRMSMGKRPCFGERRYVWRSRLLQMPFLQI